ncbi:MAG TPA: M36 family metallopeptidase [Tepidisphaeraceae bacterium]|nr:M36 family metallopeptidase [Tepidisphaeraceae bacterium]
MGRVARSGRHNRARQSQLLSTRKPIEKLEQRLLLASALDPYVLPEKYIFKSGRMLTSASDAKPLDITLNYLSQHAGDLGLVADDVANPLVTDQYTDHDSGTTHIYLQQRVNGISVDNTSLNINLTRDGRIISIGGAFVSKVKTKLAGLPKKATIAVRQSLQGLKSLGLKVPTDSAIASGSLENGTAFKVPAISLDPIRPQFHYVATSGGLAPVYRMTVRTPDGQHWYNSYVNAVDGTMLFANDWVDHATYNVYPQPIESPNDAPGGTATRSILADPFDPTASPFGWHDTNGVAGAEFTDTRGNNVSAQEDADANDTGGFRPDGTASLNFDFPIDFTQAPVNYRSAAITNLFYWNNLLHDVHYKYGFTEAAGNFETLNYSGQGLGGDAVQADAQDGSGTNNANFATPPDGQAPRMQMYLFNYTSPNRDGDLDAEIIVHEYGHGVSNRLTGGPANANALIALQSGGMGEGWSDWWALMFTQDLSDTKLASYPQGTYVLGQASNGAGIRRYPYSYNMSINPQTIGNFNSSTEVHDAGELWCDTLWDMNWLLVDKYGYNPNIAAGYTGAGSAGNILAMKLVMDALKLQPANPSFKDARDAILLADQQLTGGANQYQIWSAFARRGMGYSFVDTSSSAFSVTQAFDFPPGLLAPMVVSQSPSTVSTTPISSLDLTFSKAMNLASFDMIADINSFTGPGGVDLKSQITGFSWTNSNSTLHLTFNAQSLNGLYTLSIGPQILAGDDGKAMDQDADGTPGEAGQDTYSATFRYDAFAGQVVSTNPANGSLVQLPLSSIDFNFNETIDPASVTASDLTVNQGSVTGAQAIDSDTVRFTVSGLSTEGTLSLNIAAGAILDAVGNPTGSYSGTLALDFGTIAMPAISSRAPSGSMIYTSNTSGTIGTSADSDAFTINLLAGQVITAFVHPAGANLRSVLSITDPNGSLLGVSTAAAANKDAVVQTVPIQISGIYTITVSSADLTSGAYAVQIELNAAVESEEHGGSTNNTPATAQNLDPSALNVGNGASIASVIGYANSAANTIFTADFESGANGFTTSNGTTGLWHLSTGRGTQSGHSSTQSFYYGQGESANGGGNYATGVANTGRLISPSIALPSGATLDFNYVLQTEGSTLWDYSWLQISTNGGTSWTTLATYNGVAESSTWRAATTVSLAAYSGQTVQLGWFFNTIDNVANGFEGWYVDDVRIQSPAIATSDYYSMTLLAGQSASIALASLSGSGSPATKLYDASNNLLASGTTTATNVQNAIANFVAPANGVYYVQVSGANNDYSLVTTRGAAFDFEPNSTRSQSQVIGSSRVAVGGLETGTSGVEPDNYTVGTILTSVVPGITLSVQGDSSTITSRTSTYRSTGAQVFAHGTDIEWYSSSYWLRADIAGGATSVSIDLVPNDTYDPGIIRAYNSAGTLLQEVTYPAPTLGSFTTMTVTRPTNDIAYILAAGLNGDTAQLDHLVVGGIVAGGDYYSISAKSGDKLNLSTLTPGSGPGGFGNTLNPKIELYDPNGIKVATDDNSSPDGRNAMLAYTALLTGNYSVSVIPSSAAQQNIGEYILQVNVTSLPDLSLTLPQNVREDDGTVVANLDISAALPTDLQVALVSSNPSRLSVPATILIPAGQTSVPLELSIQNNSLLDGTEAINISATSASVNTANRSITIHDDESATLNLSIPASATEGIGTVVGTVTSSAAPTRDVAIQLVAMTNGRVTVPASVILKAGQTSANFNISVVDNGIIDGREVAIIVANVENWMIAGAPITVKDNDATLSISTPASGWEGQTLNTGTVRIGGTLGSDLIVHLLSNDATELSVPATVTIVKGQTSATFNLSLLGDGLKDGSQTVQMNASAISLGLASSNIVVHDSDLDHLMFDTINGPKTAATAFGVTAHAFNIANEQIAVFAGGATIGATGLGGALSITPVSATFSNGVWTGNVTVNAVDAGVALSASVGSIVGTSNVFAVQAGPVAGFQWGTISTPQNVNVPFNATLAAKDANGYTANFNGSANLSGFVGNTTSQTMLGNLTPTTNYNNGTYTVGYNFTLSSDVQVTAVRSYFGSKVSIWTSTGTLLASQAVSGSPTVWTETSLITPLQLKAGTTYRITVYTAGQTYYWRSTAPTNPPFATIGQTYEIGGDAFPTSTDTGQWWLVDFRGNVGSATPVPISLVNATFVNGAWSGVISASQIAAGMRLRADDGAGHIGESNPFDVTSPVSTPQTPDLVAGSDTGVLGTDNVTNLNNSSPAKSLQFSVGGTVAGAIVTLYANGVAIGSAIATGTTTLVATNGTTLLADGTVPIVARQTVGVVSSGDSPALSVTIDSTPPTAPGAPDLQTVSDSGTSSTDNITNVKTPVFTISASPYFRFYRDNLQTSGDYQAGTSYMMPSQADGTHDYGVAAVDVAGNISSLSAVLSVTIDTIAPAVPAMPDLRNVDDSGASNTDNVTRVVVPTLDLSATDSGNLHLIFDGSDNSLPVSAPGLVFWKKPGASAFQPSSVTIPAAPYRTITADVNGDGKPDLISSVPILHILCVNLGNGDGTFQSSISTSVPGGPGGVSSADFNSDGKTDVVVTNSDNNIGVFFGNGAGTFTAGPVIAMSPGAVVFESVTGDINADGKTDIVVAERNVPSVRVLLGNGDGTFKTGVSYAAGGATYNPTLVDMNHDGKIDIMVGAGGTRITTLLGNGDGTFQNYMATTGTNVNSAGFAIGDFNNDGKPDLIMAEGVTGVLRFYRGEGDGTITALGTAASESNPNRAFAADFDLDGNLDVAIPCNNTQGTVDILFGNGNGTFKPFVSYNCGITPSYINGADFNADGRLDIALAAYTSGYVSVLMSKVNGVTEGSHTAYAVMEDLAGNQSSPSSTLVLTIDSIAAALTANSITTADTTPPLTGTTDDWNASINVIVNGSTYTAVNNGSTWMLDDNIITPALAAGTYTYTVTATDLAGNVSATSSTLEILPPPRLQSVNVADGSIQRSMVTNFTLNFDRPVILDPGAIELVKRGGSAVSLLVSPTGDSTVFTISFVGADIVGGSLADGDYDLTVHADKIHDQFSRTLIGGDTLLSFHRLFGDSDGDRDVDGIDAAAFTLSQNSSSGSSNYRMYFDFDSDLDIDSLDALRFRQHQGKTI